MAAENSFPLLREFWRAGLGRCDAKSDEPGWSYMALQKHCTAEVLRQAGDLNRKHGISGDPALPKDPDTVGNWVEEPPPKKRTVVQLRNRFLLLLLFFGEGWEADDRAQGLLAAWKADSKRQADNAPPPQAADTLHGAAATAPARERTGRWHPEASDPIIGFVALTHAAEPVNDPDFAAGTCRHRATLHLHTWETEHKGRPMMIALERVRLIYAAGRHTILPDSLLGEKARQRDGIESVPGAIEIGPVNGNTLLGGRVLDYEWIATVAPGTPNAAPVALTVEALSHWFRVWDPKAGAMRPKEDRAKKVILDALIKARAGGEGGATPLATGTLRFDDLP